MKSAAAAVPDKEKLENEIDELASKHRGEYLIRCGYEAVLRRLLNAQIVPQEPEADDPKWETWRELDDAITAARESLGESAAAPVPAREQQFPMMGGPPIPWSLAETIYGEYALMHGEQSLQTVANRGGFHWNEIPIIYDSARKFRMRYPSISGG